MAEKEAGKASPKVDKEGEKASSERTQGNAEDKEATPTDVLLNSDEWDDPPECTVISEFHKGETTQGIGPDAEDPDLEAWLDHWKLRQSQKVLSEYHQDGAPSLENLPGPTQPIGSSAQDDEEDGAEDALDDEELVEDTPPLERPTKPMALKPLRPATRPSSTDPKVAPTESAKAPKELIPSPYAGTPYKPKKKKGKSASAKRIEADIKNRIERVLDVSTVEFLAFTVIRALLPKRVRYSVKREGIIDMDVILYDRDVILNTNQLVFEVPELSIWRIVYAYKGKAVIEFGRGVKNNIKIYRWRLIRILFSLWWAKRFGKGKREAKEEKKVQEELKEEEDIVESETAEKASKMPPSRKKVGTTPTKTSLEEE